MRAFAYLEDRLIHLAYLDEFGHVGPYVSRSDRRHNDSPVFGFAGFVMPAEEVRAFGTWFFQRKRELLDFEIRRSGKHPAVWEKKGSSLYRAANLSRYRGLRKLTGRLLTRIEQGGGHVFYAGIRKTSSPDAHDANALYSAMLRESIGRMDAFCREDCDPPARFLLALDEHPRRAELLTAVGATCTAAARGASWSSRPSTWRATATRRCRPRTGRGPGGPPRGVLEGAGRVAGERGVRPVLRAPPGGRSGQKRDSRLSLHAGAQRADEPDGRGGARFSVLRRVFCSRSPRGRWYVGVALLPASCRRCRVPARREAGVGESRR